MPYHAIPCHSTSCHVMPYHAIALHVMSCDIIRILQYNSKTVNIDLEENFPFVFTVSHLKPFDNRYSIATKRFLNDSVEQLLA